ncbi:MAG: hypothetical protein ACK5GD_05850 [Planctomycetota bacterium]
MFKILKRSRMRPVVFSIAAICFSSLLLAQDPAKPRRNDKPNPNNNPTRKSADGKYEVDKYRPGWEKPIHQLLIDHGVQIVFHGHDHIFAKQDLDGIVYQEVPQPSHSRLGNTRTAAEYGYLSGEIQPSSGHIRIRVSPEQSRVDYVRSYLPKDEDARRRNGEVSYTYEVHPK